MNLALYLSFLLTIIAIIGTPGPSAFLMINHAINYGRSAAIRNALGSVVASQFLMLISLIGIHHLVPSTWFFYITIAGSLYLFRLGFKGFNSQKKWQFEQENKAHAFFKEAFITGISNPKDILFFVILLPQFIDGNLPVYLSYISLLLGWLVCDFTLMMTYGLIFSKLGQSISQVKIRFITKASGVILMTLAVLLLAHTLLK